MQIHKIKRKTPYKAVRQVGRGGKRGKTSGRGTKGQKARAGHKIRPESRDLIKKLPKLRGYSFQSIQKNKVVLKLSRLDLAFAPNEVVSPKTLAEKGIISKKGGVYQPIKILSQGEITKPLIISRCDISKSALAKIIKMGGKMEDIA